MNDQIAETIRKSVLSSDQSLTAIALACGISYSRLHDFMGGRDIKLSTAQKLAAHFGLTLNKTPRRKRR
jgi:hypothetical protein